MWVLANLINNPNDGLQSFNVLFTKWTFSGRTCNAHNTDLRQSRISNGSSLKFNLGKFWKWKAFSTKIKAFMPLVFGVHKRNLCTQVYRIPVDIQCLQCLSGESMYKFLPRDLFYLNRFSDLLHKNWTHMHTHLKKVMHLKWKVV